MAAPPYEDSMSAQAAASNPLAATYWVWNKTHTITLPDICVLFLSYYAIIFYCSIIVDYDFERLLNTHCSHGDKSFGTLDGAKD